MKRLAGPDEKVSLPEVSAGKQKAYSVFCRYYGLQNILSPCVREIVVLSPMGQADAPKTCEFGPDGPEARGYSLSFTSRFKLVSVYVGLHGDATGCKLGVLRGTENLRESTESFREIAVTEVTLEKDPHVTHIANGFDLILEPPAASIMVLGTRSAIVKYRNCGTSERVVGDMRVKAIYTAPGTSVISDNNFHITMALALEPM